MDFRLWERRTTVHDSDGFAFELLGIEDLVMAKKTQRDKDWPMIRRLVDAHYDEFQRSPMTTAFGFGCVNREPQKFSSGWVWNSRTC